MCHDVCNNIYNNRIMPYTGECVVYCVDERLCLVVYLHLEIHTRTLCAETQSNKFTNSSLDGIMLLLKIDNWQFKKSASGDLHVGTIFFLRISYDRMNESSGMNSSLIYWLK